MWPMHLQLEVAMSICFEEKNIYLNFDLELGGSMSTQKDAKYPLQHVTYALAKFEVATSNGLGGYAFTRKHIFDLWHCP